MIRTFFKSFVELTQDVRTIHQTAYVLSAFTLLSTILALLRDRLFAHTFGAGPTLDMYNAAFRLPDLLFIVLGSLVSVFVVIPALTSLRETGEQGAERALSRSLFLVSGVLYVVVGAGAYITVPYVLPHLYPDLYSAGNGAQVELLTRILLLQPFILGLSNLAASCVQMYGRFTLFALAPVLYNLGIIAGAVLFYPQHGVAGLAWGVVFGALLHFGIQAPFFIVHGLRSRSERESLFAPLSGVGRIMLTSIPRTLSLAFSSIAFMVLIAYASRLTPGSISLFTFAFNLQAAPLALIGASYSVAAFPTLSRLYKQNEHAEFISHMLAAGRHILFWSLPLLALCIVLRAHIVRAILGTGLFTWADTRIAAATFALLVLSLAAQGITLLFVRGYYAAEKTLIPLITTACTALLSIVLAVSLASLYQRGTFTMFFLHDLLRLSPNDNASIALLALGVSIAHIVGAFVLVTVFAHSFSGVGKEMWQALRHGCIGAVCAGLGAYIVTLAFGQIEGPLDTLVEIVYQGFLAGLFGITFSSLVLYIIGNREVREVYAALHGHTKKLIRVRVRGVESHTE